MYFLVWLTVKNFESYWPETSLIETVDWLNLDMNGRPQRILWCGDVKEHRSQTFSIQIFVHRA